MASSTDFVSFSERHMATVDIQKAIKAYLQVSPSDALKTAHEIEQKCFSNSTSKGDYKQAVNQQISLIPSHPSIPSVIPTTTGDADTPGVNEQDVGRYKATYHERSMNAVVYKARDVETKRDVALKIVQLQSQIAPHDIRKEARLLQLVTAHMNIVELLGSESISGGLFCIKLPYMRYDLGSLAKKMLLTASQKQEHLRGLFSGLAAVHSAGIIHRDVKPSNILLENPDGPVKLIDFGISWHQSLNADEPADKKITDVGTGPYRPPEILFGCEDYGASLDMWAAGCTAAEVLIGGGKTLFDAGEVTREDFLGSDMRLLNSMFRQLGTPTDETWPEARRLRDWGKIQFKEFPAMSWQELLPNADSLGQDLVSRLVTYSSSRRFTAEQVCYCQINV